ncbi:unnamed protein product [Rotaria sp. Silwood2]|nr:unnamed protein product [Rotaria sp. Silwood2]CAF2926715.1 unnamed protein product [Rotaria sp. Silwood2]CAF3258373.1 unnamed protein product [Rotaria sp. Silwood2]CAF3333215.1 unnamed protein product [Rotaria sp. Silwood2]CAF4010086.1 unnamed protein product [Rotaria sp. Silwood2]
MTRSLSEFAPFNEILGTASTNVPAYSNHSDEFFSIERNFLHGIFTGIKWQCVEYARRWLLLRKGCVFKNVPCAADIWSQVNTIERVTDAKHFSLKCHPNGSSEPPTIDSLLIYSRSEEQPVGHIAIICGVGPNYVRIAEQNNKFHFWDNDYAREIPLEYKDGLYYIEDEDPISGWIEIEDHHQLEPFHESHISSILQQYQQAQSVGQLERSFIKYQLDQSKIPWLNKDDPVEKFFMELYGEDIRRINHSNEHLSYYKINQDLIFSVANVTNELHRMFIRATHYVIQDNELLESFSIPKIFWNRIRQSWINEQNFSALSRLNIAFDGQQFKALEYHADSESALFECAILHGKWAEHVHLPSTFMSAFRLHRILVNKWKRMNINTLIHVLIDNDHDQHLTALYMQNVFREAGIESKLCMMTEQFVWKDSIIVDSDGIQVKLVWKLARWENVFQDYLQMIKERGFENNNSEQLFHQWKPMVNEHPRLSEILLNDQIRVIEPLWTVILSSRAILPVLWTLYPNHPLLLRTQWHLTDDLKQKSFVKKPIVGRCDHNMILSNNNVDSVKSDNEIKISDQSFIYQEMFQSKTYDGYYPIIASWIIHDHFAGFGICEDQQFDTNANNATIPCCIIWSDQDD